MTTTTKRKRALGAERDGWNWNALVRTGNACYEDGHYDSACALYDDALALIDDLIAGGHLCRAVLMAKIVSHHNRGATLARLGQPERADREYAAAHDFVQTVIHDEEQPQGLREAARCHWTVTWAELRAFRCGHHANASETPSIHGETQGAVIH